MATGVLRSSLPLLPEVVHSLFFPEFQPKLSVQPGRSSSPPARLSAHGDGLLLRLPDFLLEECPAFLDPFPFRTASHGTLSARPLNRPKAALQKPKGAVLLTPPLPSPRTENYRFMIAVPKAASDRPRHPQALLCLQTRGPAGHLPSLAPSPAAPGSSLPLLPLCSPVFPADIW